MRGKKLLYVDQHGQSFVASTVKELRKKVGGGRVSIMYADKIGGPTVKVGYVIGSRWLSAFAPFERPVKP